MDITSLTPQETDLLKAYLDQCGVWRSDDDTFEMFQHMENLGITDANDRVRNLLDKMGVEPF